MGDQSTWRWQSPRKHVWNWSLGHHRPSPTSYHGSKGVWEQDFDLRYCCSQCTVILPIPPSFSMGEKLREGREEGFGCTTRLAESSQDSSTGFTCLNSSLHGVSLPFTLKIATVYCETLILNASLDCFQKASQFSNQRNHGKVIVTHLVSPFLPSPSTPCPRMEFIKSCTLHRMQTDILFFIWKFSIHR